MTSLRIFPIALLLLLVAFAIRAADDDKKGKTPDQSTPLVVIDSSGKEFKVKKWTWKVGTRRLNWLATEKGSSAPQAFAIREDLTIHFLAGVTTLVPLDRLRSIMFDEVKGIITVRAVGEKEEEISLVGTTKYKGINKVTIEAEVDKGDSGVAEVTYQGGVKGGIKGLKFPTRKLTDEKPGRPAFVQTADRNTKAKHRVSDLLPLYQVGQTEKTSPTLMFKKTLKLDVSKLKSLTDTKSDGDDLVWSVAPKSGEESTLTLLQNATIDGSAAQLQGFVGKVPVGFKLFPLRRIAAVHYDATEEQLPDPVEEKDEKDKKKE